MSPFINEYRLFALGFRFHVIFCIVLKTYVVFQLLAYCEYYIMTHLYSK